MNGRILAAIAALTDFPKHYRRLFMIRRIRRAVVRVEERLETTMPYWPLAASIGAVLIASLYAIGTARADDVFGRDQAPSPPRHHVAAATAQCDQRPRAWCGWWLRCELGVADRAYNRARHWTTFGTRANGPAAGVIAVWPHHVGIVTAVPGPGRIVLRSGNDGHAVRERERSTRGVIAWRWPGGMAMR